MYSKFLDHGLSHNSVGYALTLSHTCDILHDICLVHEEKAKWT